jgi:uncharacterized protein
MELSLPDQNRRGGLQCPERNVETDSLIEMLEKAHQFPGPFTFKAIGRTEGEFVDRVIAAIRQELAFEFDPPFSTRMTPGGRHVAVTIEPHVNNAAQVIAVYASIRRVDGLISVF